MQTITQRTEAISPKANTQKQAAVNDCRLNSQWLAWNYLDSVGKCNRPRRKAFFAIPFHSGLRGHFYLKIGGLTLTFFVVKLSLILSRFLKLIFIKYAYQVRIVWLFVRQRYKKWFKYKNPALSTFFPALLNRVKYVIFLYYSAKNLMPKVFFNTNTTSIFAVNYTIQQFNTTSKSLCWKVPI